MIAPAYKIAGVVGAALLLLRGKGDAAPGAGDKATAATLDPSIADPVAAAGAANDPDGRVIVENVTDVSTGAQWNNPDASEKTAMVPLPGKAVTTVAPGGVPAHTYNDGYGPVTVTANSDPAPASATAVPCVDCGAKAQAAPVSTAFPTAVGTVSASRYTVRKAPTMTTQASNWLENAPRLGLVL